MNARHAAVSLGPLLLGCAAVVCAGKAVMAESVECQAVELAENGEVHLTLQGTTRAATLSGAVVPSEEAQGAAKVLDRLAHGHIALRCTLVTEEPTPAVRVEYLAWRDKTGDVWKDLAATLIEEGLARVAPGDFPSRGEYLALERAAQAKGRGVWRTTTRGGLSREGDPPGPGRP